MPSGSASTRSGSPSTPMRAGCPPLRVLAHLAALTAASGWRPGGDTPLENVVRVAEDAVVADLLSGGRMARARLGLDRRRSTFGIAPTAPVCTTPPCSSTLDALDDRGSGIGEPPPRGGSLLGRVWQATFSSYGGTRAGAVGHGCSVADAASPEGQADLPLPGTQQPIVDAYLAPAGRQPPRIWPRTLVVTDTEAEAEPPSGRLAALPSRPVIPGFSVARRPYLGAAHGHPRHRTRCLPP